MRNFLIGLVSGLVLIFGGYALMGGFRSQPSGQQERQAELDRTIDEINRNTKHLKVQRADQAPIRFREPNGGQAAPAEDDRNDDR